MVGVEGVKALTACDEIDISVWARPKSIKLCATFSQHDVRRLQIAMDDALLMRLLQGLSDFGSNLQDLIESSAPFSQALGEGSGLRDTP